MVQVEDELEALVAAVRSDRSRREELVELLAEGAPLYAGRGMSATARLRGWVLAAFEDVGLPALAVPFVYEELESGVEAHLVAAAAKAARGGERDPALGPHLVSAFVNMASRDDTVTFEALRPVWPATASTTAILEVLGTVRWLGTDSPLSVDDWREQERLHGHQLSGAGRDALAAVIATLDSATPAHSCCPSYAEDERAEPLDTRGVHDVELENQDAQRFAFGELRGQPTVIAWFYTRCPNPNKCSLSITQLAALQQLVADKRLDEKVRLLALTYDPGYDEPARLRQYGEARGLRYGPRAQAARAVAGHDRLRDYLELRVGYNGSIVNRHGIELFLLDAAGAVVRTWSRIRWDPADVLTAAAALA